MRIVVMSTPHSIGRYEVVAPLATGGMGELFLARRSGAAGFARLVVLKRLRPELGATATYRDMFFDEARLAARLTHPNVCEVYDLEEHGDDHFLAMPYLEGVPASALLPPPSPLTPDHVRLVAGILVQVLDGLHHAHELRGDDGAPLGVVHRDVSPGNVFVTTDGVVKLLDFGVAKVRGAKAVTEQGVVKGKLAYMAPEQLADGSTDRRADLFCVAIVGWEGLLGRPLFARASATLTAAAVLDEPIARADAAAVPAELADVLERALAREPHRRYATAAAMREAIEAAMSQHGGPARPPELARALEARCAETITAQRERIRSASASASASAAAAASASASAAASASASGGVAAMSSDAALAAAARSLIGVPPPSGAMDTVGARPDALATTVWSRPTRSRLGWLFAGALAVALAFAIWIVFGGASRKSAADAASGARPASTSAPGTELASTNGASGAAILADGTVPKIKTGSGSGSGSGSATDSGSGSVHALDFGSSGATTASGRRGAGGTARARAPGIVSIDSTPWAALFIDGKRVGITPYIDKPLAAGKHSVRAVLENGRARTFSVDVPEGKHAKAVDLRW